MTNRTNWRYIARYMRSKGYTVGAIEGTLTNLGKNVSPRTIYRVTEGIVPETLEMNESLTRPLSMYAVLMQVLEYGMDDEEDPDCQNSPDLYTTSEGDFLETDTASLADLDLAQPSVPRGFDGFAVYGPTGSRSGLQSYLYRCAAQDREMSKLPEW